MGRIARLLLLSVALAALASGSSGAATRSPALLPDLRLVVPANLISIGLDGSGHRELRFTHITANLGPGLFELDPHYNAKTGVSTFSQALHRRNGSVAKRVPLATYGTWEPPSDYRYPLSSFTLNNVGPGGTVGAVVARSLKVDYCMTGDVQVPGYPSPPSQTSIPESNCADPTLPLGWSAGWGDEYDQTDAGQPISLVGVPDGTYVLRATVDPEHVVHEVTTANDVTDTTLHIVGDQVSVVSQKVKKVPLPRVRLTGAGRTLTATVSPPVGKTVQSVQFILDGRPAGRPQTTAPFTYTVTGRTGVHFVSARVTDTDGVMGSALVRRIVVPKTPAVRVTRLVWRAGLLELRLVAPRGVTVTAVVAGRHHRVRRGSLNLRVARPKRITLAITSAGGQTTKLVLPLDSRPAVHLVNPGPNETVSGFAPVAADATDTVGVRAVRFTVDGKPIGSVLRTPAFHVLWDTRKLKNGPHLLAARATSATGLSTVTHETVDVSNPAPPMTCFVLQHQTTVHGTSFVTTDAFQTVTPGETLLALVSADGPQAGKQTAVVAGGGLHWKLASRANSSPGDAEVWEALATTATTISPITATLASGGYDESLSVVAMEAADGVGATAHASGLDGAPHLMLTTAAATSLVFAAGNDWDRAAARKLPVGWVMLDQWLNSGTGDTYWSQYTNHPTGKAGTRVSVRDTAPTNDSWNLAAVELVNSGD
ncbi:MAG TPA: Ig-like domain-containing protein [Gaiellaceae bacterium]|nr:Ig-like domain-containing protein [Gaiellaceae bacterium]